MEAADIPWVELLTQGHRGLALSISLAVAVVLLGVFAFLPKGKPAVALLAGCMLFNLLVLLAVIFFEVRPAAACGFANMNVTLHDSKPVTLCNRAFGIEGVVDPAEQQVGIFLTGAEVELINDHLYPVHPVNKGTLLGKESGLEFRFGDACYMLNFSEFSKEPTRVAFGEVTKLDTCSSS